VTIGDWHSEFCDPFPSNFPAPVWSRLCWDSDSSAASFRIAFQAAPKKVGIKTLCENREGLLFMFRGLFCYISYIVFFFLVFFAVPRAKVVLEVVTWT